LPDAKPVRKRGRPPLPKSERKLSALGFRPTPGLRSMLNKAAERNGRSVGQEVQSRLERSFQEEDALGGAELHDFLKMLGSAARVIEARTGKRWAKDFETFSAVKAAWNELQNFACPPLSAKMERAFLASQESWTSFPSPPPPVPPSPPPSPKKGLMQNYAISQDGDDWNRYRRECEEWTAKTKKAAAAQEDAQKPWRRQMDRLSEREGFGKDVARSIFPLHKK